MRPSTSCASTPASSSIPDLVPLFIEEADRLDSGIAPSVELPPAALLGRDVAIVPRAATLRV